MLRRDRVDVRLSGGRLARFWLAQDDEGKPVRLVLGTARDSEPLWLCSRVLTAPVEAIPELRRALLQLQRAAARKGPS